MIHPHHRYGANFVYSHANRANLDGKLAQESGFRELGQL